MKLLLKAAFRTRKHFTVLIFTFISLLLFTVTNQMEMFALGTLSNSGADFFTLFAEKEKSDVGEVRFDTVKQRWSKIDRTGKGVINQQDAALYLSKQKHVNPLDKVIIRIRKMFNLEPRNVLGIVILLIIVASIKALVMFSARYCTQLLSIRISHDLRQQYFEHIQSMPMSFFQKYSKGSLSARVGGDAAQIATSLNSFITNYFQTPFTVITTFVWCCIISWELSLIIFFGLPLIVMPILLLTKKVRTITRQWQRNQERFTSVLIDFLAGIQTVKIFAMERFSLKKYKEHNDQMADLEKKTAKYDLLTRPILHTITTICLSFVAIFGLYVLEMSLSQLIIFCGLLYVFYEPVKKFAEENANIQKGAIAAERLFEVLNLTPEIEDKPGAVALKEFSGSIEFDKVWFKYDDRWVIKDLSFTVKKGQTVALVGATGAGKSTIVQLLPRLYDIQKGEIRINGKPLDAYTQKSIREIISFVPQKPFLFYDTISENITVGRPYTLEQVVSSAKRAHAHDFITNLPDKYQSHLAETGQNLSGGQQQRLAIARALFKNAPVLILDEATSSLDSVSEQRIKEAIQELHGSVTQILIAHRLSTIEHADRIIFLEDGEKLAEGTKEELLKTCPPFKVMWETHFYPKKKEKRTLLQRLIKAPAQ